MRQEAGHGMTISDLAPPAVVQRGQAIYDKSLRDRLEPVHVGKFVAIDVMTGDYEIDVWASGAMQRLRARNENRVTCLLRIGHAAAFKLRRRFRVKSSAKAMDLPVLRLRRIRGYSVSLIASI